MDRYHGQYCAVMGENGDGMYGSKSVLMETLAFEVIAGSRTRLLHLATGMKNYLLNYCDNW